uniref:Uncharacterized protein n=1 Tax=Cannabis sativa TaxID=3483 RepID=A0A803Q169_CANSA
MCQRMLRALKKRSSDAFGQKAPMKCPKVDDTLPKSIALSTKTHQVTCERSLTVLALEVPKLNLKMAYTYSPAKSTALKVTTTTNNLKKEMEEAKKEVELKSTQLDELETDDEALAKDVNSLKDERDSLHTLLSSLETKVNDLTEEKKSLQETLDFEQTSFGAEREAGVYVGADVIADMQEWIRQLEELVKENCHSRIAESASTI